MYHFHTTFDLSSPTVSIYKFHSSDYLSTSSASKFPLNHLDASIRFKKLKDVCLYHNTCFLLAEKTCKFRIQKQNPINVNARHCKTMEVEDFLS